MSADPGHKNFWRRAVGLYADGFRGMTWGRPLWALIILKLIIMFAVLRVFFFRPVLSGKTDEQKSEYVGNVLTGMGNDVSNNNK